MSTFPSAAPVVTRPPLPIAAQKRWFLERMGSLVSLQVNIGGTDGVDLLPITGSVSKVELGRMGQAEIELVLADGSGRVHFPLLSINPGSVSEVEALSVPAESPAPVEQPTPTSTSDVDGDTPF